ncbi:probable ubiquitin-conjugating enzyme protein 17 [Centruroides vittatus]
MQNLLKTTDPVFFENLHHVLIGTHLGNWLTTTYNKSIYYYTMKYAILKQLHFPPPGFEEVVKAHFYLKRNRIIKDVENWAKLDLSLTSIADTIKKELKILQPPNEDVAQMAIEV